MQCLYVYRPRSKRPLSGRKQLLFPTQTLREKSLAKSHPANNKVLAQFQN